MFHSPIGAAPQLLQKLEVCMSYSSFVLNAKSFNHAEMPVSFFLSKVEMKKNSKYFRKKNSNNSGGVFSSYSEILTDMNLFFSQNMRREHFFGKHCFTQPQESIVKLIASFVIVK